jgi:hypothetical protein
MMCKGKGPRNIVIAGVNGCYREMQKLLTLCKFVPSNRDRLYLLGDVSNYGREPYHTANFAYHMSRYTTVIQGPFEKMLQEGMVKDHPVLMQYIQSFPTTNLAWFHIDRLKRSVEEVATPWAILRWNAPVVQHNDVPYILGTPYKDGMYTLPYTRQNCVYINTLCIRGNSLTATVIYHNRFHITQWEYYTVYAHSTENHASF